MDKNGWRWGGALQARRWWAGLAMALLGATGAQAAVSLSLSPSGYLPDNRNTQVVVTARWSGGAAVESFAIWYNGRLITTEFTSYATVTRPDNQTIVATVDLLFPAGSHTLTASLKVAGEAQANAGTTFHVPDLDQTRLRSTVLARVNEMLHRHDAFRFSRAISLGDPALFAARASDPSFQVYVDPVYLKYDDPQGTTAQYVEKYYFGLSYYRDLVLGVDPELFGLNREPQARFGPVILWHEMVHAMSHLAEESGSPNRLQGPIPFMSDEAIDHFHLYWAEHCMGLGLERLKVFEQFIVQRGTGTPSATDAATARNTWRQFVSTCNASSDPMGVPTPEQRATFKRLTGFHIDPAAVKAMYREQGFSGLYFDATVVTQLSPADGASVTTEQVTATARVSTDASAPVDQAGFLINGAVQMGTLAGDTFSATLPLRMGSNTLQPGVIVRGADGLPGQAVLGSAITVTRKAPPAVCPQITTWSNADQSLYAPLRITRVDHENTPGYFYFYLFANPNNPQEKVIRNTYFSLRASPSLTRDMTFANNVGVSLISFASAADASLVWSREMATWDATPPGNRPDLVQRDATMLLWSWTAIDGAKNIEGLYLHQGSVIVYVGLKSLLASDVIGQQGVATLLQRASTTLGLVDVKCGGR
ncbi:MAG: Ig-like domain-containing protein [Burkholderiales bacterium]|nr:Ig-like domain-containing protein [Burkholderiales bacterium]